MKAIAVFNESITGTITFHQESPKEPLHMHFYLKGFVPYSIHAIHIHEFGDLTEGCKSLGGHFNPTSKVHGHSENGHAGDLFNNFRADLRGRLVMSFDTVKLSIFPNSKLSIIGRSVVIHEFQDDYGLEGVFTDNGFISYKDMDIRQLSYLYNLLGYHQTASATAMRDKLISESKITGNASARIACAIIGITYRKD